MAAFCSAWVQARYLHSHVKTEPHLHICFSPLLRDSALVSLSLSGNSWLLQKHNLCVKMHTRPKDTVDLFFCLGR